ncbi:transposase, partial [Fusarium langsethiae]
MFSQKTSETAVADDQFINHLKKRFTKDAFQRKLVRWIVETNQPFRVAESESLRDIFNYLNPIISATDAHLSHDSIRRRITDDGVLEDDIDAEAYDVWLKRGPIGKLHNTMVWINRSNRVTEMLREAQRQDTEKSWPGSLDVIIGNNTRWLSQFYMMSRALKVRPYIDTVIADTIGFYHDLLRHFETCVKKLEGDGKQRIRKGGKEAAYGLVQDICPAYEWLMGHLEEAKSRADRTPEPAQCRTNINFAWVKLNKYYSAIDQSPVYYAATVLHPAIRWDFLHRAYRERPDWIGKAQQLIDGLWQEYKQLPVQFERGNYDQLRPIKRAKEVEDSFSSYLDSFKSTTTARLEGNEGDE